MRGQVMLEFLFAVAVYLAFLFILVNAHADIARSAVEVSDSARYAGASQRIAVLWPLLRLGSEHVWYNETWRWLGGAELCFVRGAETVICGSLERNVTVPIYIGREDKYAGREVV